jgi:prophage maintenance system killer protein
MKQDTDKGKIEIYTSGQSFIELKVKLSNDTVWLNREQMARLFDRDRTVVSRHITNIFREGELKKEEVCAIFAHTTKHGAIKGKEQTQVTEYYNLDVIISVGYRVKSLAGTQFRIWANQILKEHLINGYTINKNRLEQKTEQLKELQKSVKLLGDVLKYKALSNDESIGLLKIISDYAYALDILDKYDYQQLEITGTSGKEVYQLTYEEAMEQIKKAKKAYGNSELFGREKDKSFKSSIATIFQTFDGEDLYPSIEEKAANLLYFVTKNHSFTDGNKRIAAFLFLYFLERNRILFDEAGNKRIADNTLVALTLMIAVSKPEEKDMMVKVIVNLINKNN